MFTTLPAKNLLLNSLVLPEILRSLLWSNSPSILSKEPLPPSNVLFTFLQHPQLIFYRSVVFMKLLNIMFFPNLCEWSFCFILLCRLPSSSSSSSPPPRPVLLRDFPQILTKIISQNFSPRSHRSPLKVSLNHVLRFLPQIMSSDHVPSDHVPQIMSLRSILPQIVSSDHAPHKSSQSLSKSPSDHISSGSRVAPNIRLLDANGIAQLALWLRSGPKCPPP